MQTWIALLRGINVGGHQRLPMQDLRTIFETAGSRNVATYIQSGNVVFNADIDNLAAFGDKIGDAVETGHGFRPDIHLLTANTLRAAIEANPYPEAVSEPQSLHLTILSEAPQPGRIDSAKKALTDTERFTVIGECLYMHAPDGLARSKFAANVARLLDVSATSRNWKTVTKLAAMASQETP